MPRRLFSLSAIAALALAAAPAIAATPAISEGASSAKVSTWPVAGAVKGFYASHRDAPIWTRDGGSGGAALVDVLRRSSLDGFAAGPQLADRVAEAMVQAKSGDRDDVRDAEQLMSAAWTMYVRTLKSPTSNMIYGDRAVSMTPPPVERILADASRASSLADHVRTVSTLNPLYAKLRDAAWASSRGGAVPAAVVANLDRARSLPASGKFVMVDAATQTLFMYQDGRVKDQMKVIVGKPEYATPMIASMIYYATVNPYWHVPDHLIPKTIAPGVLKGGTKYLKDRGYQVVSDWGDDARIISPTDVDWKAAAAGQIHVKVRQLPGGANSMGKIKFPFENGQGIYLHDTPEKALFAKAQRTLSNGCVRLEDAPRLARFLMGSMPTVASTAPEQSIAIPGGVPVYITYLTAHASDGALTWGNDVYQRDSGFDTARVAALQ